VFTKAILEEYRNKH